MKSLKFLLQLFGLNLFTLCLVACGAASGSVGPPATSTSQAPTAIPTSLPPTSTSTPPLPTATLIAGQYTYDDLIHMFDYDRQEPLDVQEVSVSDEEDGVKLHDISYTGATGEPVSAFLVVPPGEGPFAGVIFMHWGGGAKYSFLNEAILLAKKGGISLLIHAPFKRESGYFIETVINLRRGVDVLTSRPDVDAGRLGYVGHSWGGTFGGILADVDKRFKTYILMAGVPSFSEFWNMSEMTPLDGVHYIGQAAPSTLFFQFANQDESVNRETALLYYEAASEPKHIKWYDTNHRFKHEEAQQDRLEWLSKELGLP